MKRFDFVTIIIMLVLFPGCHSQKQWNLVWSEEFDGAELDTTIWSNTVRGHADWENTQSSDPRCWELRNGTLVLRGIVNDHPEDDLSPFLTGGMTTRYKKGFWNGRLEVCARLHGAGGAWPAIWLLPFSDDKPWPDGGEIDLMERLNDDNFVHQTVHSRYTELPGADDILPHGIRHPIDKDDYNIYGIEMYADSVVLFVNRERTLCYPRIHPENSDWFPFNKPFYLLVDMQLGGSWVGDVNEKDLPVEMEVDWVRFYQKKQ